MDIVANREFTIIPEVSKDDKKPIKIRCKYLSGPERHRIMQVEIVQSVGGGAPTVRQVVDAGELIKSSVVEITDFSMNGESVSTAARFNQDDIPGAIYDDVVNQLIVKNKQSDLKN